MTDQGCGFQNDDELTLLKKVDMVRERTGVSYRQAKETLEKNQGDLLQTLIDLEEREKNGEPARATWAEEFSVRSTEVVGRVKELIRQGNINKIRIKHEGKVLADIPISLGAIGAVALPQLAALGVIVAMFNQCTIEVIRTGGPDSAESTLKNDEDEKSKIKNDPF